MWFGCLICLYPRHSNEAQMQSKVLRVKATNRWVKLPSSAKMSLGIDVIWLLNRYLEWQQNEKTKGSTRSSNKQFSQVAKSIEGAVGNWCDQVPIQVPVDDTKMLHKYIVVQQHDTNSMVRLSSPVKAPLGIDAIWFDDRSLFVT